MLSTPIDPNAPAVCAAPAPAKPQRQTALIIAILALTAVAVSLAFGLIGVAAYREELASASYEEGGEYANYDEYYDDANCNVAGIPLRGSLYTYLPPLGPDEEPYDASSSENIVDAIRSADEHENIKAILLQIDSYGGSPVAAEEIANALKRATKPTIALIRESGNSAAYWAATGADLIYASANSDVGSIGVTSSYVDNVTKNETEGLRYNELTTGKFKDLGSPDRELTEEERDLVLRDIKIIFESFIKTVVENRKLDDVKVREMADGSSMVGSMALEKGLIDKIGSLYEAEEHLTAQIGEEAEICW